MNQGIQNILKIQNIDRSTIEKQLNFDLDKEELSIENFYKLSKALQIPLRNLMVLSTDLDVFKTYSQFVNGVLTGNIEKIKRTIEAEYIVNVVDKLYFTYKPTNIYKRHQLTDDITQKLFQLLIANDEWQLARTISSSSLFYSFENLDTQTKMNYLFGTISNKPIIIEDYAIKIFKGLNNKSKKKVEEFAIDNYIKLFVEYREAKEKNLLITKDVQYISIIGLTRSGECNVECYIIDDLYKEFDSKSRTYVENLLKELN